MGYIDKIHKFTSNMYVTSFAEHQLCLLVGDYTLSDSNHLDGAAFTPRPPPGFSAPKTDLAELFSKLGLGKYTDLFQQQEVR